jgi:GH25 family lysozyme M1 (1,4-beta-N-acetylmuramidase)
MALVLDVSEFGGVPDFAALKAQGAEGVIVRTSSGPTHVDTLARRQVEEASAAGLVVLAGYHYTYSNHDGAHQAAFAIQVAESLGLPVAPDFEKVAKGTRETDAPHLARVAALAFLRHHRSLTGRVAVVYGPVYYLRDLRLEGPDVGPLWAAHVGAVEPFVPPPWRSAVLHQYQHNASGVRPGTVVDWNRSDLSIDELVRVFRGEGGTRPPPRAFVGPAETFKARGGLDIG